MNYLQEHYSELSNLGKGVLICYHDNMVEIQELGNLSGDSYKNLTSIQSEFIEKLTDTTKEWNEWSKRYYDYTRQRYSSYFSEEKNIIIKGIEDFKKDFPYFPLNEWINETYERKGRYSWRRQNKDFYVAQALCLAVKFPQIEMLFKTKFKELAIGWLCEPNKPAYARCFKSGKNLDEITKLPKYAWNMLIDNVGDIDKYNEMRIWVQKENLSKETIEAIFDEHLRKPELEKVRKLCMRKYNDKSLYNIDTLLNYLHRCDVYQAIPTEEAIDLLNDYIKMSIDMGVEPLTNSNSLKREHDVMARNYWNWYRTNRNAETERKFVEVANKLQKYEYENDKYIIITPHSVSELLEEANQQRNCLACYADRYADGRAKIFFMRKKKNPEKSYISIEMSSDLTEFRQVYYACNRPVDNAEELAFLDKWKEHIKTVKQKRRMTTERWFFFLEFPM